ncbi:hypothetical protein LUZ62_072734 [Rhynchospora pubera]|uniref:Uncharacterized protein n=1 Tax=Rhynchospora pubera TaxID=906938 RepID=A0AAV8D2V4_9POAL|nr:hypothetical protein LUZ62_072734 [Rhynchospora pubera]
MLRPLRNLNPATSFLRQSRWFRGGGAGSSPRGGRRDGGGGGGGRSNSPLSLAPAIGKSEWWAVDGEMHEVGEGVPRRERFVIPRDNLPNRKRKQMREHFMRRTRLVLKDSEQEAWCKRYMELYQEQRENWERLYWDAGYSKKIAQDHATYDSADEDDMDFSPYRRRRTYGDQAQGQGQGFGGGRQDDSWERVQQVRDKFEYDREKRMKEKAFAPMNMAGNFARQNVNQRNEPFDSDSFFR